MVGLECELPTRMYSFIGHLKYCVFCMTVLVVLQKELLKTKEALFRLSTNLRQLPDRSLLHTHCFLSTLY